MLPVLVRWAWAPCATLNCATPPLHCAQVKCCLFSCKGRGRLGRRFTVLPPPPRLYAACFGAMGADVPLLCGPPCTAVRISAARFWPLLLQFVRALNVYPTVRLGAALMLRFW